MADSSSSLTYISKSPIVCPVCDDKFHREELRTGRGRLIAGNLTQELRRLYEPSQKYGEVFPLVYPVTVCPSCYYAAYAGDFSKVPEGARDAILEETEKRTDSLRGVFDTLAFSEPRGLAEGIASYFFAIMCYEHFPKDVSPTFKRGLSALRAAWLSHDMHRKHSGENFDYMARVFYRKARFFYTRAVELEQTGKETISVAGHLGPDLDKNYGYDGVLYVSGYLEYKHGPTGDPQKRAEALNRAKRTVARIFGMGRASKNKPAAILDNARDLYEEISAELGKPGANPEEDNAQQEA